jgi:hypothetical protein
MAKTMSHVGGNANQNVDERQDRVVALLLQSVPAKPGGVRGCQITYCPAHSFSWRIMAASIHHTLAQSPPAPFASVDESFRSDFHRQTNRREDHRLSSTKPEHVVIYSQIDAGGRSAWVRVVTRHHGNPGLSRPLQFGPRWHVRR